MGREISWLGLFVVFGVWGIIGGVSSGGGFCGFSGGSEELALDFSTQAGEAVRQSFRMWPICLQNEQMGGTQGYSTCTGMISPVVLFSSIREGRGLDRFASILT